MSSFPQHEKIKWLVLQSQAGDSIIQHKPKEWHLPSNKGWAQTADKS